MGPTVPGRTAAGAADHPLGVVEHDRESGEPAHEVDAGEVAGLSATLDQAPILRGRALDERFHRQLFPVYSSVGRALAGLKFRSWTCSRGLQSHPSLTPLRFRRHIPVGSKVRRVSVASHRTSITLFAK